MIIEDKKEYKNKKNFIEVLKFLAVLLVFNSHMDGLYPVKAFATGGAIGNTIFFFVSGYTWMDSANNTKFIPWYGKKLKRIYIPTLITNIAYVLLFFSTSINFFQVFIYPNNAWFCGSLLLYAIFYYFLAKCSDRQVSFFLFIGVIVYFAWYFTKIDFSMFSVETIQYGGLCRILYYAICMIVGLLFKERDIHGDIISRRKWICITFFAIGIFYFEKYLMSCYNVLMVFQCINQFTTLLITMAMFITLKLYEDSYNTRKRVMKCIRTVSMYSWELYLIQLLIIPLCEDIIFPLNCISAITITIIFAWLLKKIVSLLVG
jgi:hypothetical protein